ncbi:MAG: FKBP-type peptidyl-prolyl cis-trans isomerase [Cellvibrionales bacterium]|nr:FKBP-type peptidyl-prolyl cis-trans isomerase [Cellvibrionales bacterium]
MSDNALNTAEEKVSYGFGLQFGQQLLRNQFDQMDVELVCKGIKDIIEQKPISLSEADLNQAYSEVQQQIEAKKAEDAKKMKELGVSYLNENAKRDGVKVTDSGIQYEILEQGSGEKPTKDSTVKVHYHGTFIDGEVFDSSVERDEPATFGVTQVISGWTETLQLMNVGDKWRITLPPELAYGEAGAPPSIPPQSVLVFEIHLLDIV